MHTAIEEKRARDIRLGKFVGNRVAEAAEKPTTTVSSTSIPIRGEADELRTRVDTLLQEVNALRHRAKALEREVSHAVPYEMRRVTTIRKVIQATAKFYKIPATEMYSVRRYRQVVKAKQMAMYLSKTLTAHSLPEIGRRFGGRDHTTVLHACERMTSKLAIDADLRAEVDTITKMILGGEDAGTSVE